MLLCDKKSWGTKEMGKLIEKEFHEILRERDIFKYSSMNYLEYKDVESYEIVLENENIILLYGFNYEAKTYEYHWATNKVEYLIKYLHDKKDFLITFIPHQWIYNLEKEGFIIRNAWHDYFMNNLDNIKICDEYEFLTVDYCDEASQITQMCKNQSRVFTGQTTEWMKDWISNKKVLEDNDDVRNKAAIIERNANDKIVGILCVATYGYQSEKGPIVWIREIAVDPSFQNRGIGRRLILKALSYGKKHNATRAFLAADEQNVSAIHLYKSIGFSPSDNESQIDMLK